MDRFFRFPELRVVEASAGSGKTYALARRYVQLLLLNARGGDPLLQPPFRSILALTFTNKAAFEMKARILEFLKKMAFSELSPQERGQILAPLEMTDGEAARLASGAMEGLIRHYNYFQVQTIDKFINALLVGCAFKVGLSANFRIRTDARAYLAYALDGFIDAAASDRGVARLFEEFIDHYLYLENRSPWLPRKSILDILGNLFSVNDTYGLPFQVQDIPPGDIIREKKAIVGLMKELHDKAPLADLHATFVRSLTAFLSRHSSGFDFDSLSDFFQREEIPLKKNAALSGEVYALWDRIRGHIRELANLEMFCLYSPYLRIYSGVRQRYEEACRREDVLFLSELNRKAAAIFSEGITPEEIYYRLAARFRHYLIDEFQDTSRLQWRNLSVLPKEGLSSGGSLFYVGDKKQAIYSFRGGEAGLFDEVKGEFSFSRIEPETLSVNWRSEKAVVEFNNAVFSMDNLRLFARVKDEDDEGRVKKGAVGFSAEDMQALERIYGKAQQAFRPGRQGGYVRMEHVDAKGREEKLELVQERFLGLLRDLEARKFAWQDIAVLARSNTELEEITCWLLEKNIPVASERTSDIKEHPLIREIVAFLAFLDRPYDNPAFAQFIMGDIFLKASGIDGGALREFLLKERLRSPREREPCLYRAFERSFPVEWQAHMAGFLKDFGLYPLYELVVSFYARTGVLANFPEAQGFLMHFLELIKNREEDYYDAGAFLADYESMSGEELFVRLADRNAVRLLTFHKAKGLEFPVVILPFLTMKVDVGSAGPDKKQAYVLREGRGELSLLRIKKDYGKYSSEAGLVYEDEYKKNFLSELNMIYVALTRASVEMYAFLPLKAGSSRNLARQLIPPDMLEHGERTVCAQSPSQVAEARGALSSVGRDWVSLLKDEFMDEGELPFRLEREEGERYHTLLAGTRTLLQAAADTGLPPELKAFIMSEAVRPFFDVPDEQVFTEREFIDRSGATRRVDRLIVSPEEVLVVDFKMTSRHREAGERQLRGYKEVLRDVFPGRGLRAFLLFIKEHKAAEVS
jgi:ATP-dependent exoDNAse (exonuclease V) beta subunit